MGNAIHTKRGDGVPGQRRQQHASHGIPDGDPKSLFQRLDDEAPEGRGVGRLIQVYLLRHLDCSHGHGVVTLSKRHYFEYNSTMSCSFASSGMSARSGTLRNVPTIAALSRLNHGSMAVSFIRFMEACTTSSFLLLSRT